jgi:hypothetical protein
LPRNAFPHEVKLPAINKWLFPYFWIYPLPLVGFGWIDIPICVSMRLYIRGVNFFAIINTLIWLVFCANVNFIKTKWSGTLPIEYEPTNFLFKLAFNFYI